MYGISRFSQTEMISARKHSRRAESTPAYLTSSYTYLPFLSPSHLTTPFIFSLAAVVFRVLRIMLLSPHPPSHERARIRATNTLSFLFSVRLLTEKSKFAPIFATRREIRGAERIGFGTLATAGKIGTNVYAREKERDNRLSRTAGNGVNHLEPALHSRGKARFRVRRASGLYSAALQLRVKRTHTYTHVHLHTRARTCRPRGLRATAGGSNP